MGPDVCGTVLLVLWLYLIIIVVSNILRHIVTINSTETMVEAPDNYLLFRSNEVLMENTTYEYVLG